MKVRRKKLWKKCFNRRLNQPIKFSLDSDVEHRSVPYWCASDTKKEFIAEDGKHAEHGPRKNEKYIEKIKCGPQPPSAAILSFVVVHKKQKPPAPARGRRWHTGMVKIVRPGA